MKKEVDLGKRLTEARKFLELSQGEFGDKVGLAQSNLSKFERGTRTPSLEKIWEFESVFGIRSQFILTGEKPILVKHEKTMVVSQPKSSYNRIVTSLIDTSLLEQKLHAIESDIQQIKLMMNA